MKKDQTEINYKIILENNRFILENNIYLMKNKSQLKTTNNETQKAPINRGKFNLTKIFNYSSLLSNSVSPCPKATSVTLLISDNFG